VADLIRRHRRRVGSRWRRLPPGRQALLVLAHLRRNETFAALAAAFGVGAATAHRYVTEVIELLADLAPDLRQAMRIAQRKAYVILDGRLVATDRLSGANDRLHYSGKHRRHGANVQFLTDPHGELLWASPVLPGSTHDLTAAREHGIIDAVTARAIACYADKGYVGAGGAVGTPYKRKNTVPASISRWSSTAWSSGSTSCTTRGPSAFPLHPRARTRPADGAHPATGVYAAPYWWPHGAVPRAARSASCTWIASTSIPTALNDCG
jgi:hypothetical protein